MLPNAHLARQRMPLAVAGRKTDAQAAVSPAKRSAIASRPFTEETHTIRRMVWVSIMVLPGRSTKHDVSGGRPKNIYVEQLSYLERIALNWIGLDWTGLDWTGLDWIGLDCTGLDWIKLD